VLLLVHFTKWTASSSILYVTRSSHQIYRGWFLNQQAELICSKPLVIAPNEMASITRNGSDLCVCLSLYVECVCLCSLYVECVCVCVFLSCVCICSLYVECVCVCLSLLCVCVCVFPVCRVCVCVSLSCVCVV